MLPKKTPAAFSAWEDVGNEVMKALQGEPPKTISSSQLLAILVVAISPGAVTAYGRFPMVIQTTLEREPSGGYGEVGASSINSFSGYGGIGGGTYGTGVVRYCLSGQWWGRKHLFL